MVETYKEDLTFILQDYKDGTISEQEAIKKSLGKLSHHISTLKHKPGMCARTLNAAIELCDK